MLKISTSLKSLTGRKLLFYEQIFHLWNFILNQYRLSMATTLQIRRKVPNNQSTNQSINQSINLNQCSCVTIFFRSMLLLGPLSEVCYDLCLCNLRRCIFFVSSTQHFTVCCPRQLLQKLKSQLKLHGHLWWQLNNKFRNTAVS